MIYLSKFDPEMLNVEYRDGVEKASPIISRKYTLTHSDETGELFLTIGEKFAYDRINKTRDEVLAEWIKVDDKYILFVYVLVDGKFGPQLAAIRDTIFRKELPLALYAIFYGDKELLEEHKELYEAPIIVYFKSSIPQYNKVEKIGDVSEYIYNE